MIAYNHEWPDSAHPLQIDLWALSQDDAFLKYCGITRLEIYLKIHKTIWTEDIQHRWFTLGMKGIVENKVCIFLGSASSGKTYLMSVHALIDFFAFPNNSLAMISSTEKRSLEIKIWGRIKGLFNRAKEKFPWLPGYILDAAMAITPTETDDDNEVARLLDRGIICVPCVSGGRFVGMGRFQGAKPPHSPGKFDGKLKHYADELALMQSSILDAYSNWTVNPGFKGIGAGNPIDISDTLCTAAEPVGGWDSFVDNGKTQEWKSKWYGAHCIAYDGRDTPNNDHEDVRFPFLLTREWMKTLVDTHGFDSWQVFSQGIGKPSKNMISWRVITMALCAKHKAHDDVIWKGSNRTSIYSLDPAYGGGDRCVGGVLEFGEDVDGRMILLVNEPEIIPIRLNSNLDPEEQIAAFVKDRADKLSIPPTNIFYDSFGRGTLGFSFAKIFGFECPVPVDSGMRPTARPVRFDLFVEEITQGQRVKRLKRCDEHYSKFITEMWFSTREAIQSEQIRGLPKSVAEEGQLRMYKIVQGNKIEVEPKDDMKERIKKSPDLYDWFSIGVEGARRLGFKIQRLGTDIESKTERDMSWFTKAQDRVKNLRKSHSLSFR